MMGYSVEERSAERSVYHGTRESGGITVQVQGEVRGRESYAPPVHTNWIRFVLGRHFQVNKR